MTEDVPYGFVFQLALARVAGVSSPATEAVVAMAELIVGEDFSLANDLIHALRLETVDGSLTRVGAGPTKPAS